MFSSRKTIKSSTGTDPDSNLVHLQQWTRFTSFALLNHTYSFRNAVSYGNSNSTTWTVKTETGSLVHLSLCRIPRWSCRCWLWRWCLRPESKEPNCRYSTTFAIVVCTARKKYKNVYLKHSVQQTVRNRSPKTQPAWIVYYSIYRYNTLTTKLQISFEDPN